MKRLIILTLAMVLVASVAWAETYQFITPSESKEVKKEVTRKIEVVKQKEYLEITVYPKDSKPVIYRIWPCGSVERQEWKEISGNKEVTTGSSRNLIGYGTTDITSWNGIEITVTK
jgi:hypothetical protein